MSHFLVHQNMDDHRDVYGVFGTIDEFVSNFMTVGGYQQACLWKSYRIDEMAGTVLIDTIYVEDIIERDELKEEAIHILDTQPK